MTEASSIHRQKRRYVLLGVVLLLLGVALIGCSFVFRNSDTYYATLMISVGAGLLPTGTVILLEPWLIRNVSKSARQIAEMSAKQAVADVRSRLDALSAIRDVQSHVDTQHDSNTAAIAAGLLDKPSYQNMWRLLQSASSMGIFAHDAWIIASQIDRYLIRFDIMEDDLGSGRNLPTHIRVTLGELRDDLIASIAVDKWLASGTLYDSNRPGVVVRCWSRWDDRMSFQEACTSFRDACAKAGLTESVIDWGRCLNQLVENFETATARTNRSIASDRRFSDPLKLNINDQWYIVESNRLVSKMDGQSYSWNQLFGSGSDSLTSGTDDNDHQWQTALHYARYVMAPAAKQSYTSDIKTMRRRRPRQTQREHLANLIASEQLTARQIAEMLREDLYRRDRTDLELLLRNKQFAKVDALHRQWITDFINGRSSGWSDQIMYIIGTSIGSLIGNVFNRNERLRLRTRSIRSLKHHYLTNFGEAEEERLKGVLYNPSQFARTMTIGECWGIEAARKRKADSSD